MKSHILGLPRIGAHREWKFALESFWKGTLTEQGLEAAARALRAENRARQVSAGLDWITVGDFAAYDHVLTNWLRYTGAVSWAQQFRLARGDAASKPWGMTKWFDTNYHYLVPELSAEQLWQGEGEDLLEQVEEALAEGIPAARLKPVLLGPVTLLALAQAKSAVSVWDSLPAASRAFHRILENLAARGVEWVQVDEPILVLDADPAVDRALESVYGAGTLRPPVKVLLATYFGPVDHRRGVIDDLSIEGLHLDLVRGAGQLAQWTPPAGRVLSLGLVDGRNIWRTEDQALPSRLAGFDGRAEAWVGSSCSLLHVPVDLSTEPELPGALAGRLAFAVQKLGEVARIAATSLRPGTAPRRQNAVTTAAVRRSPDFATRSQRQASSLGLPLWPTTTIGSFPQTKEVRQLRAQWKKGTLSDADYEQKLKDAITDCVRRQEALGLDVLVHGEFERNDMVESFAELLAGFAFTHNGWVQSYGSRCVKPPVLHGAVARVKPLTVGWTTFAQGLTSRPLKGMLTGPVTLLQWSFVREDVPRAEVAFELARALEQEVLALEAAGIRIIQVDEPAFREGLPLRSQDHDAYWAWAVESFHRSVASVRPETQIHTHMCYSDFSTCLGPITALDADVITIETSRSSWAPPAYPNGIGPGVWDIHSPRVPSVQEMVHHLKAVARSVPVERLWVNPDCGLKTRDWPEVEASLNNLVAAAQVLREQVV